MLSPAYHELQEQHRKLMDAYKVLKNQKDCLNKKYSRVCVKYCKFLDNMLADDAKYHTSEPKIDAQNPKFRSYQIPHQYLVQC